MPAPPCSRRAVLRYFFCANSLAASAAMEKSKIDPAATPPFKLAVAPSIEFEVTGITVYTIFVALFLLGFSQGFINNRVNALHLRPHGTKHGRVVYPFDPTVLGAMSSFGMSILSESGASATSGRFCRKIWYQIFTYEVERTLTCRTVKSNQTVEKASYASMRSIASFRYEATGKHPSGTCFLKPLLRERTIPPSACPERNRRIDFSRASPLRSF